jgi:ribosome-associated protein
MIQPRDTDVTRHSSESILPPPSPALTLPLDTDESLALARYCAQLLDFKKLRDVAIYDVRDSLQITDFFVLASGLNSRQLKGASDFIEERLKASKLRRTGLEGYREGGWILLDFDVVVVHLFLEAQRRLYDLELLWGDSPRIDWSPLPTAL